MILRRVARPLLSAIFVSGGINALRQLEGHAQAAQPLLDKTVGKYADRIPDNVPTDTETLIRIDAGVKIGAGVALALGKAPRVAAVLLLGSLGATTAVAHRFWEENEPENRDAQLIHFLKNCGLAGGLMLAAADTHGKPSAAWWARHSAHLAGDWMEGSARAAQRTARQNARQAKQGASHAKRQAQQGAKQTKQGVKQAKSGAGSKAQGGLRKAQPSGMSKPKVQQGRMQKAKAQTGRAGGGMHKPKQAQHNGSRSMRPGAMKRMQHTGTRTAEHRAKQARYGVQAEARKAQAQAHAQKAQAEARRALESARGAMTR